MSSSPSMRKRTSCLSRRFSRSLRLSSKTASSTTTESSSSSSLSSSSLPHSAEDGGDSWSTLLPELLVEIMERVEAREDTWREVTREIVNAFSPQSSGKITFPSCLKQVPDTFVLSFANAAWSTGVSKPMYHKAEQKNLNIFTLPCSNTIIYGQGEVSIGSTKISTWCSY